MIRKRSVPLSFIDHRENPADWARALSVSTDATELLLSSDVIDLHIDTFIWHRIFGYDPLRRHGPGVLGGRFYSQVDFPRALETGLTGATWIITTNPLRGPEGRKRAFVKNVSKLLALFERAAPHFEVVKSASEYRAARAAGKHGAFVGIQGGNALDASIDALDAIPDGLVLRVTLVHLSSSRIGATSSPMAAVSKNGLHEFGRDYVKRLVDKRILVDLAHISRDAFYAALEVHDKSVPAVVTHTGVCGVHDHWRNLTDDQLRAIANTGGTIGIMYHAPFLGDSLWSGSAMSIARHIDHVVRTVGDDHVSLGSDWDGAILTPRDMPTCLELPRLVQCLLDLGYDDVRIRKILAGNFLRVVETVRG